MAALEILNPPADRRAECQREIAASIAWLRGHSDFLAALRRFSKRKKLSSYVAGLRRLQGIHRDLKRDPWCMPPLAFVEQIASEIDRIQLLMETIGKAKRDDGRDAYEAVRMAECLLSRWGHEATLTRDGPWHRLSLRLYARAERGGEDEEAMLNQMRNFRKTPNPIRMVRGKPTPK